MNTSDIKHLFSTNGNGHSLSRSVNRALGRSRGSRLSRSLPSFSGRHARTDSSAGVALPFLLGIGAVALIGAGLDMVLRRNSGKGIMGQIMGSESLKYRPVHGTTAARMPEPQENG